MSVRGRVIAIEKIARGPSLLRDIAGVLVLAILRLVERLVLAAALCTSVSPSRLGDGLQLAALAAVLHIVRSVTAAQAQIARRVILETRSAAAVLAANPMQPLGGADLDVFATFLEGTELLMRLLVDRLPDVLGDGVAVVILAGFVATRLPGPHLVFFTVLVGVGGAAALLARRVTASEAERAWDANGPLWRQLRAVLGARDEIVATGASDAARRVLGAHLAHWASTERRYRLVAGLSGNLPMAAVGSGIALAVLARWHGGLDANLVREGSLLAGVGAPLASLVASLQAITRSEPAIGRLLQLVDHGGDAVDLPSTAPVTVPSAMTARDLRYRYPGADRDALSGASFVWRRGRILAVGGRNGAGKSTLLRLLLRLDAPSSGTAIVDGGAWSDINDGDWRASVAYVAQTPYLHDEMTVGEVCRLLAADADDRALEAALRRVQIWERLTRERDHEPLTVPLRLLSAGMRQRVVLARALAQDRPILVLDEPDASLDADGVAQLATLLREIAPGRLIAVVAHASALLEAADDRVILGSAVLADPSAASSRSLAS